MAADVMRAIDGTGMNVCYDKKIAVLYFYILNEPLVESDAIEANGSLGSERCFIQRRMPPNKSFPVRDKPLPFCKYLERIASACVYCTQPYCFTYQPMCLYHFLCVVSTSQYKR